jgi:TRAP-type transport system periplasmic protein
MPTINLPLRNPHPMKRRSFLRASLTLAAGAALTPALPLLAASGKTRIRLATLLPKDTSSHKALVMMGEKWRQVSQGTVEISNIYTDGVMGSEPDMLRRIRAGQLQAAVLTSAGIGEIDPVINCIQKMPLVFHSLDEQVYVRTKMMPRFQQRMRDKGFELLFLCDAGWIRFFSKVKAVVPDDFRKLKIFAERGDEAYIKVMRQMGFQPVPLDYTDTLTSLSTGNMLDALSSPPFYALAGQFYTAAKHMVDINWTPLSGGTVVSRKLWDGLPAETQTALLKIAEQTGEEIQAISRRENDEAVAAMEKRGLVVHKLEAADKVAWEGFSQKLQPLIRESLVPADTYDEVLRLVKEYRAGQTGAGR